MQEYINMLSSNLQLISVEDENNHITFTVKSSISNPTCPHCGMSSNKCHSKYFKSFDDLPLNGKRVTINILNRKMFCLNPNCNHKTFSENFDFVEKRAKKTIRLKNHIVDISVNMSSISAQNLLRKSGIKIGKSTICTFLKKR